MCSIAFASVEMSPITVPRLQSQCSIHESCSPTCITIHVQHAHSMTSRSTVLPLYCCHQHRAPHWHEHPLPNIRVFAPSMPSIGTCIHCPTFVLSSPPCPPWHQHTLSPTRIFTHSMVALPRRRWLPATWGRILAMVCNWSVRCFRVGRWVQCHSTGGDLATQGVSIHTGGGRGMGHIISG
jgi:hypothetical protein